MARGPRLVQRLSGLRAKGMLGAAEGPSDLQWLSGSGVGTEQCQVEPWPRDQPDVGSMLLAPAKLEHIAGFLDRDGFPPGTPLTVVFGQHEKIDVDLVPILGQRLAVVGGTCCNLSVGLCLA